MNNSDIIFFTICWARTKKEEKIISKSIKLLSEIGFYKILIIDGGSKSGFLNYLKKINNIKILVSKKKTLYLQLLEGLSKVKKYSAKYILYAESDKYEFFNSSLENFLLFCRKVAQKDKNFGMIIPSRNKKSFATYSNFQQSLESATNEIFLKVLGKRLKFGDITYGPRLFPISILKYFSLDNTDLGWGWLSYLALSAHWSGKKIYTTEMDLACPDKVIDEDDRLKIYRLKQFKDHLIGMERAILLKNKKL